MKLRDQVAIVTGSGSKPSTIGAIGTGKAIALLFAEQGASVVLVDRHEDRANETQRQIEDAGGKATVIIADLADLAGCEKVVEHAVMAFGRVDILVNNAAAFNGKGLLEITPEEYHVTLTANLTVPFMLSRASIPVMTKGGGGAIVNIGSIAACRGAGPAAYAVSKGGMISLTTSIANEFGKQGIRANCIAVGGIDTPLRRASGPPGEYQARPLAVTAEGDAWDIARAALFLASSESAHITGVLLPVDGGIMTMMPSS